jgi:hypothetical protein
LFASLNYLEGKLITRLAARPRPSAGQACHQEWLAFLKTIDAETPADLAIHIIADNYATHRHPAVTRWLDRHARFHMHYTPTSSCCFRDGTLELHCPHRGASLEFRLIDAKGIRCRYHGWQFAVVGTIVETPGEPAHSTLKDRLYHGGYPTHEYGGIVFAYMGPPTDSRHFLCTTALSGRAIG